MSAVIGIRSVAEGLKAWLRAAPHPMWLLGPLAVIVAVPVADGFLPPDIHLAHVLDVAVAVVALGAGPRLTALIGSLSVLALIMAGAERRILGTESVVVELGTLVALCAFLVFFTHLRDRGRQKLVQVRSISDATQRVVLRPLPERAGPVELASRYRGAEADACIGGDLYAVARISGSTRLLIGDVRGKGLASISDTAVVLGAFRAASHRQIPLPQLVGHMEDAIRWGLAEFSRSEDDAAERFVTAAIVDIPDNEPVVHLVSCGHPPPLLLHRDTRAATALVVPEPAPPLGLGAISGSLYLPATFPFGEGDRLMLYTDGVSEARDRSGVFYPLTERVTRWADQEPETLLHRVVTDLQEYTDGHLDDDMAIVVARRDGKAAVA
ncbi:PP2C family protein-serine/threonine phosphatase [Streptomyces sp. WAC07094]|uniref:PP2C family protein-serine/threonine phosphatase n=1 Tax=Streptomyces sp. WAC07094 TaxID=3072183 RepID=UPI002EC955F7|nr:PP2C family protein-serine/threonine phosphatase [Streptomyces sp. WAC07094]